MAFAGTEGYTPVVYAPYILAAALGNLFGLDFPNMLLADALFRPDNIHGHREHMPSRSRLALKWAFVLVAMLPVSIYNRSVLSADGAALACALVVTALCFSAVRRYGRVWERSFWMTLCALSKQPQIVFALLELMACSKRRPGTTLEQSGPRRGSRLHPFPVMGPGSIRRYSSLASSRSRDGPARAIRSFMEARIHVGTSASLPAGSMDGPERLGRSAVGGADRCFGVAGHSTSTLDLSCAHVTLLIVPLEKLDLRAQSAREWPL